MFINIPENNINLLLIAPPDMDVPTPNRINRIGVKFSLRTLANINAKNKIFSEIAIHTKVIILLI